MTEPSTESSAPHVPTRRWARARLLVAGLALSLAAVTFQAGLSSTAGAAAPAAPAAVPTSAPPTPTRLTTPSSATPPVTSVSPSATMTCPPALPSAGLVSATRTSLVLSVSALCRQVATVHVYSTADASVEAGAWTMPTTLPTARVRFVNLVPDTAYWYRVTWVVGPDAPVQSGPVVGPVRTAVTDPVVTPVPHPTPICLAIIPSLSLRQKTAYSLAFLVEYVCDRSATVRVFADAAGKREVARWTIPPTYSATGSEVLVVTRLNPDTAYWYGLYLSNPDGEPTLALQATMTAQIPSLPPSPTVTTPSPSSTPCGSAQLLAATRTTLTFAPSATCSASDLTLFSDADGKTPVGVVSRAAGAPSGDIRFANLMPETRYWHQTSGADRQGPVTTTAVDPTATPSPGPTVVCPPVQPTVQFATATDTELQFSYQFLCGRPIEVHLYADATGTRELVTAPMAPARTSGGTLDVGRLPPGTAFYWNYTQNGVSSPIQGPARTTTSSSPTPSPSSCAAVLRVVSRWADGFAADVEIRNTGTEPIAWSVAWTWTGGESLAQAWNATVAGTASSPVLTGASWNRQLRPGEVATPGLLGRGATGTAGPSVTCVGV